MEQDWNYEKGKRKLVQKGGERDVVKGEWAKKNKAPSINVMPFFL